MFCQGYFPRVVRPSALWGLAGWKEILRSQNKVRWNGTEERPEWGASPEKPSKPLRFDTGSASLLLGLCAESLAGSLRIRSTFQRECVLSRSCVCARRESLLNLSARMRSFVVPDFGPAGLEK